MLLPTYYSYSLPMYLFSFPMSCHPNNILPPAIKQTNSTSSRPLQTKQAADDGCITFSTRYIHVTDKPRPHPPPQEPIDTGYGGGGQQQSKQPPNQPQPPKKTGPGNCKSKGQDVHRKEVDLLSETFLCSCCGRRFSH